MWTKNGFWLTSCRIYTPSFILSNERYAIGIFIVNEYICTPTPPTHPPPSPARKKRKWVTFKSLFMCRSIPPLPWKTFNQFTIHIVKWLGPWPPANKVIHWIPLPLENVTLDWNSAVEYEIISHRHAPDIEYSYNHNIPQTL